MRPANAIGLTALLASLAILAPALAAPPPDPPAAPQPPDDPTCLVSATASSTVWTSCSTGGDYRASNLTLSGHARVAGPVSADSIVARAVDVAGEVRAASVVASGSLSATHVSASDLQLDEGAQMRTLTLAVLPRAPAACAEGALAIVRLATGADAVQACLANAKGATTWVTIATPPTS